MRFGDDDRGMSRLWENESLNGIDPNQNPFLLIVIILCGTRYSKKEPYFRNFGLILLRCWPGADCHSKFEAVVWGPFLVIRSRIEEDFQILEILRSTRAIAIKASNSYLFTFRVCGKTKRIQVFPEAFETCLSTVHVVFAWTLGNVPMDYNNWYLWSSIPLFLVRKSINYQ